MKDEFCTNNSLIIEAAVVPFDTNILLLFSRDMVYELEIKTDFEAVITSAEKLGKRFKTAEPPIDYIENKIDRKDQIQMTNVCIESQFQINFKFDFYDFSAI